MGVWSPVVALQEEVTNWCIAQAQYKYAADFGNELVVNDTFTAYFVRSTSKRQFQLSGADTGDDRKGTVE